MAHTLKRIGKLVLPLVAVSASVFGLAAGSDAHSVANFSRAVPVSCEISVSKGRYGHIYEGIVRADRPVNGTYQLNISKRGGSGTAIISQSGEFQVAGGATETLGQATFGGVPPSAVEAVLTLWINGRKLDCTDKSEI